MRTSLFLLPVELFALLLVGLGLASILGLIRPKKVAGLFGFLLLIMFLGPFVAALKAQLPAWLLLLMLFAAGLFLLRQVAGLLLGAGAADNMIGHLAADVVRFLWALIWLPFRAIGRARSRRRL